MKEIKMTNQVAMEDIKKRVENKEFDNQFDITIAILESINNNDEKALSEINIETDTKRREQIIKWLNKLSTVIKAGNLKENMTLSEMLTKIDNKEVLTEDEILPLLSDMFDTNSMSNIIRMLGCLLVDSSLSFIINPEEDYYLSLIHGYDSSNIERTSIVLDLGKGNSTETICDNFFQGFMALFLLNDIVSFYDLNFSFQVMKDNKVIENLVQHVLKDVVLK